MTWQPVARPPQSGPVTGYAVYADGKKVTDVDSPTGDHALIDIGKLVGLNPKAVTVRTKSRDSQSSDSQPTLIPSKLTATHSIFSLLIPQLFLTLYIVYIPILIHIHSTLYLTYEVNLLIFLLGMIMN